MVSDQIAATVQETYRLILDHLAEGGVYYAFQGSDGPGGPPVRDTDEIANEFKQFIISFFKHSHVGQGQDMYKYR
jgi:hypothetical protein